MAFKMCAHKFCDVYPSYFYDVCKLCTDKFFIISLAVKFLRGAITGTGLIVTQGIF